MLRTRTDRPRPVPHGATNLGLLAQFAEVPREVAFTIDYSTGSAWEAIHRWLRRGPAPAPLYQGQYDPSALLAALKTLV
jgi:oleate hydratase